MSKLAIVTGGTRGIGAAISLSLKNNGYHVIAGYANNDKNANVFSQEHSIETYKWDVSDFKQCHDTVNSIRIKFDKPVSVLINNAGITKDNMLHKMTQEDWLGVIDTNLNSCFNMCRAVIDQMRQQEFGRIVNISSVNALVGQVGQTNYSASKAAIIGFTKALARESASKKITVNVVAPGYTETEMISKVPKAVLDKIVNLIPVGRLGFPQEVARAVAFLVSDEASFITGETLSINGGHNMY